MFTIGHSHDVAFKVNVMGTSAEPTVRLVLGCTPELSFPAKKTADGWACTLSIPPGIEPCECDLRVEAIVNNRLFTPLIKRVELASVTAPPVETAPQPASDAPPAEIPPTPDEVPSEIEFKVKAEETEPRKPLLSTPEFKRTELPSLQKVAEATPPKKFEPIHTPLPRPSDVKVAPIKVSLTDVMKVAATMEAAAPPPARRKAAPVVEIKHETPVRLVKGAIIYE